MNGDIPTWSPSPLRTRTPGSSGRFWLRDPRFADIGEAASFLPVEIARAPELAAASPGEDRIEIAGGRRLRIVGGYDPEALARLLRGLSA